MYSIDLEDAVKVGYNKNTNKHILIKRCYHAQRLYQNESRKALMKMFRSYINALCAVGRFLAALLPEEQTEQQPANAKKILNSSRNYESTPIRC